MRSGWHDIAYHVVGLLDTFQKTSKRSRRYSCLLCPSYEAAATARTLEVFHQLNPKSQVQHRCSYSGDGPANGRGSGDPSFLWSRCGRDGFIQYWRPFQGFVRYALTTEFSGICPICIEAFSAIDEVRVTPCAHVFHRRCVDPWFRRIASTCPSWYVIQELSYTPSRAKF